jgi:hypothetical protein
LGKAIPTNEQPAADASPQHFFKPSQRYAEAFQRGIIYVD